MHVQYYEGRNLSSLTVSTNGENLVISPIVFSLMCMWGGGGGGGALVTPPIDACSVL